MGRAIGQRRLVFAAIVALALAAPIPFVVSAYNQEKRNAALIAAIHSKNSVAALALIRVGANPNTVDSGASAFSLGSLWHRMRDRFHGRHSASGPSALDLAVQAKLSSVACALLDRGAIGATDAIQYHDKYGDYLSPLLDTVVTSADCNVAARLISHGADVNRPDALGRVPLYLAATNGDLAMVSLLVVHHANPNACRDRWPPPLVGVPDFGATSPVVTKYLLDHGANPNGDGKGNIPLLYTKDAAIVAALISHGADVRMHTSDGESPIVDAAINDNYDGMRILLDHGASVDGCSIFGATPLHIAAVHGRTDSAALLLRRGADVNLRAKDGRTPLMLATQAGSLATVRLLLRHGATTTARDSNGRTALFMAASAGDAAVVIALIRAASPVNARDIVGETALDEAEEAENGKAAAVLRAAGARSGTAAGRIPAIGRIVGLRLGYAADRDIDSRLIKWPMDGHSHYGNDIWVINDASIEADGFEKLGNGFEKLGTGYIIDAFDASGWHGRLRSNAAFKQRGSGPWGDLRIGMTVAEARTALRSKLPTPIVKAHTLCWIAHAHGRRAGKSVLFTYTATLNFGDGLQGLHIDITTN